MKRRSFSHAAARLSRPLGGATAAAALAIAVVAVATPSGHKAGPSLHTASMVRYQAAPASATASQCLNEWNATGGSQTGWFDQGWPDVPVVRTTIKNGPNAGKPLVLPCGDTVFGVVHIVYGGTGHGIARDGSDDANVAACVTRHASIGQPEPKRVNNSLSFEYATTVNDNGGAGTAYLYYDWEYAAQANYVRTLYTTGGATGNEWFGCAHSATS